jgi:hypothetical protein
METSPAEKPPRPLLTPDEIAKIRAILKKILGLP